MKSSSAVRRARFARFVAVLLGGATLAGAAGAAVSSNNVTKSATTPSSSVTWFDYASAGTPNTVTPLATDTFVNTAIVSGAAQIASGNPAPFAALQASIPWWDTLWLKRSCFTYAAGAAGRVIDLKFDSTGFGGWLASGWVNAGYTDVRVQDGATALLFWNATPFDTTDGHLYIQIPTAAAGTGTSCVYLDNDAATTAASNPYFDGGNTWGTTYRPSWGAMSGLGNASTLQTVNASNTGTVNIDDINSAPPPKALAPWAVDTTIGTTTGAINAQGPTSSYMSMTSATIGLPTIASPLGFGYIANNNPNGQWTANTWDYHGFGNTSDWYACFSQSNDGLGGLFQVSDTYNSALGMYLTPNCVQQSINLSGYFFKSEVKRMQIPAGDGMRFVPLTAIPQSYVMVPQSNAPMYGIDGVVAGAGGNGVVYAAQQTPSTQVQFSGSDAATATAVTRFVGDVYSPYAWVKIAGGTRAAIVRPAAGSAGNTYEAPATETAGTLVPYLPMSLLASDYFIPSWAGSAATPRLDVACINPTDTIQIVTTAGVVLSSDACVAATGAKIGYVRVTTPVKGARVRSSTGSAIYVRYQMNSASTAAYAATPMMVSRWNWALQVGTYTTSPTIEVQISTATLTGTWTATRTIASPAVYGLLAAVTSIPANSAITWKVACRILITDPINLLAINVGDPLPHSCDGQSIVTFEATFTRTTTTPNPTITSVSPPSALTLVTTPTLTKTGLFAATGTKWLYRIHGTGTNATSLSQVRSDTGFVGAQWTLSLVDSTMVARQQVPVPGSPVTPGINVSSVRLDVTTATAGTQNLTWTRLGSTNPLVTRKLVLS